MAEIAKITDLTKLEGDPDPSQADIPMYLAIKARAPWKIAVLTFVARCSEQAPAARALVVAILTVVGIAAAAVTRYILAGLVPGPITASVSLLFLCAPAVLYLTMTGKEGRRRALRREAPSGEAISQTSYQPRDETTAARAPEQ